MNRIISISPYYKGQDESHVYWFEESLKRAAKDHGFDYLTVANQASPKDQVIAGLSQTPTQRHKITYFPFLRLGRDVRSILRQTKSETSANIWHVYDGGFREFLLICCLLAKDKQSKAAFNITTLNPWLGLFDKSFFGSKLSRKYLARLNAGFNHRLRLFCDSIELASEIDPSGQIVVGEYPMFSFMQLGKAKKSENKSTILMAPCDLTEFNLCLDAIEDYESNTQSPQDWVIQMRWGGKLPDEVLRRSEKKNLIVITKFLDSTEYAQLYLDATVVVLPYLNRRYYKYQSSGRLLDSVVSGSKVVVPDGTVLSRKASTNNWGYSFNDSDPNDLSKAIREAADAQNSISVSPPTGDEAITSLFENWHLDSKNQSTSRKLFGEILYFSCAPLIYRAALLKAGK